MENLKKFGTKDEVFKGEAIMTTGKLTKDDLVVNKYNKVVSKKAHARGKALHESIKNSTAN